MPLFQNFEFVQFDIEFASKCESCTVRRVLLFDLIVG